MKLPETIVRLKAIRHSLQYAPKLFGREDRDALAVAIEILERLVPKDPEPALPAYDSPAGRALFLGERPDA